TWRKTHALHGADKARGPPRARAEMLGEEAAAHDAARREHAADAERRRGDERRKARVDEEGDELDEDRDQPQGGEKETLHHAPVDARAHGFAQRPLVAARRQL